MSCTRTESGKSSSDRDINGETMASSQQAKQFIKTLAPYAQEAFRVLGKIYPSICIAMACVECGYGTAGSVKYHSYFGQKVGSGKTATKYWDGTSFNAKTKEEYKLGEHTTIKADFRSYRDMRQSVFNFYELLNSNVYKRVEAGIPYQTQMKQIKECGYMTSSTEVNSVLSIISRYDLTRYDNLSGAGVNPSVDDISDRIEEYNMRQIKTGSKGNLVKLWQIIVGVDPVGIFGNKTYQATISFQKAHGLQADGIVGPRTWKAGLESVQ